jgi:MSHA biogenesis protein MshJ
VNAALKRYAERVDAMTLRERALIFAALALALIFIADAAFVEPLRAKQKRLAAESAQRQNELKTVQAELRRLAAAGGADLEAADRRRAAVLRAELAEMDARIADLQRRFTPPERVRAVLDEMLERNKRLRLVELKTLPVSPMGEGARAYRHGVELTVSGTYLDLYGYLSALERLPTQLYWGKAEMSVAGYPAATLRLTVYTVSFDKAWLIV